MGGRVLQPAKSLWRTGLWLDSQLDPQVDEEELWVDDEHNLVLNAQGYSYWLGLVVAPEVVEELEVFQEDDHQANSCVVSDSAEAFGKEVIGSHPRWQPTLQFSFDLSFLRPDFPQRLCAPTRQLQLIYPRRRRPQDH